MGGGLGALCRPPWLVGKKILGFRSSKNMEVTLETLETISFWQIICISVFKISPFLSIRSDQFFKIYDRVDKELEKTLIMQSMRIEKLRKVRLCFLTGSFIKPFQMIINHCFLFFKLIRSGIFSFNIRDIKRRNWKWQIARGGKLNIYLKNNFNLLVMNVTELNLLN